MIADEGLFYNPYLLAWGLRRRRTVCQQLPSRAQEKKARGFCLYRRRKTSKIPRMIAGSTYGKNPIINAFIKKSPFYFDIKRENIHETAVNEPLINWQSIDGDQALEAIHSSSGWAAYASDKNMLHFSRLIREREGLNVLPASTAGLIALLTLHHKQPLSNDRYVVILTGRK